MNRPFSIAVFAGNLIIAAVVSASAQSASEAQKEALRSHCVSDFLAHCKGVPRGGLPAFECLEKNLEKLSPACQTAVKAVDPEGK